MASIASRFFGRAIVPALANTTALLQRVVAPSLGFVAPSLLRNIPTSLSVAASAPARTLKTKSAVKKRFRINGGGKIVRMRSGKRHINIHKSSERINRLGMSFHISLFTIYGFCCPFHGLTRPCLLRLIWFVPHYLFRLQGLC